MLYQDPEQHNLYQLLSRAIWVRAGDISRFGLTWLSVVFIGMAEITAIAHYVQFWFPTWPSWMIEIGFLTILALVNLIAVSSLGKLSFGLRWLRLWLF